MEEQNCYAEPIARAPWPQPLADGAAAISASERCLGASKGRHRIDPRVSIAVLVLVNVMAFSTPYRWVLFAAVALDALLLVWCEKAKLALYWLLGYAAIYAICYACIAAGPTFTPIGTCFLHMSKIFPAAMFASAMVSTTHTGELACALQSFGLPSRVTVATCVALRFFPTIAREARSVGEAMRLRGERFSPSYALRHPGALFESFVVPFVHRVSIVADELGDAVMSRGADTTRRRTSLFEIRLGLPDVVVALCTVLLLAAAVLGRLA